MTSVSIENGKYEFQVTKGRIDILRFGKPWVIDLQCAGSKAVMGLIFEVEEKAVAFEAENAKLRAALEKIYTYRADEPDWNMVMAIAGDIINPMEATV